MFDVTIFSALLGGLLTFIAPCTLPILPGYLSFLAGAFGADADRRMVRKRLMPNAFLFVLGFSLVFIAYGAASGAFGQFLTLHRDVIARVGGVFILLLGLAMLDVEWFGRLFSRASMRLPGVIAPGSREGSFALGLFFALGWSPCLGPVLGTIILLAGTTGSILSGMFLLAIYALGLAIPFLLLAYFFGTTFDTFTQLERRLFLIRRVGGALLVIMGALLVAGQFGLISTWLYGILGVQEFDAMVKYL